MYFCNSFKTWNPIVINYENLPLPYVQSTGIWIKCEQKKQNNVRQWNVENQSNLFRQYLSSKYRGKKSNRGHEEINSNESHHSCLQTAKHICNMCTQRPTKTHTGSRESEVPRGHELSVFKCGCHWVVCCPSYLQIFDAGSDRCVVAAAFAACGIDVALDGILRLTAGLVEGAKVHPGCSMTMVQLHSTDVCLKSIHGLILLLIQHPKWEWFKK